MSKTTIPVHHIAQLSNLSVTPAEEKKLEGQFAETLQVVADLQKVDVKNVQPTFQVTGLENVLRDDVVNEAKMFLQTQALANAKEAHEGYFVVPQIISQD